jgi:hypothetical protein
VAIPSIVRYETLADSYGTSRGTVAEVLPGLAGVPQWETFCT